MSEAPGGAAAARWRHASLVPAPAPCALPAAPGCVTVHPAPTRAAGASPVAVPEDHTSIPSTPGPHGTRCRRCPSPMRPCGSTPDRRRSRGRPCSRTGPSRACSPEGIRESSARPACSRPQGRRPGPAAPDDPAQARRTPRRQTQAQEGEGPNRMPASHRPVRAPGTGAAALTELCRAAHGVTSPAVAALCNETY